MVSRRAVRVRLGLRAGRAMVSRRAVRVRLAVVRRPGAGERLGGRLPARRDPRTTLRGVGVHWHAGAPTRCASSRCHRAPTTSAARVRVAATPSGLVAAPRHATRPCAVRARSTRHFDPLNRCRPRPGGNAPTSRVSRRCRHVPSRTRRQHPSCVRCASRPWPRSCACRCRPGRATSKISPWR